MGPRHRSPDPGPVERLPPHDLEAEQALLGSLLIDRDAIVRVADLVPEDAFFHGANATIFRAVRNLYRAGKPADMVTVSGFLKHHGVLDEIGGYSYLSTLYGATPTSVHVEYYAGIVLEHARRRAVIDAGAAIVAEGYRAGGELDVEELVRKLRADADRFLPESERGGSYRDVMEQHRTRVVDRWEGRLIEHVIPTGIGTIDRLMHGGLRPGDVLYIGGRPGSGKTSLMLQIANYAARATGMTSLIAELEMSHEALLNRAIAAEGKVPFGVAYSQLADQNKRDQWLEASERLEQDPVVIDTTARTTERIVSRAERLLADGPVGIVFIDHLDYLADPIRGDSVEQRTSELSKRIKRMAASLRVPVVVLSQLNRAVEERPPYVPNLKHFKNSGAIEADTDYALLLYRRKYYVDKGMLEADAHEDWVTGTNWHKAECIVAKNRNGEVTTIPIGWEPATMAFHAITWGGQAA